MNRAEIKKILKSLKPLDIIYVVWNDAFEVSGVSWKFLDDERLADPPIIYTIGFVTKVNWKKKCLGLCHAHDNYHGTETKEDRNLALLGAYGIPFGMIKSIKKVKL